MSRPNALGEWLRDRSIWKVLGVYLAGSWIVFEGVATVTEALSLPGWLPRAALALIATGLPVVAAAALLRRRAGLFTLRNALIAGVAAFAVLLGVAGFISVVEGRDDGVGAGVDAAGTSYTPPDDDPRPAIAVLPFADLSPQGDQQYFSDGMSEEILTVLSRIRELRVAARSMAFTYRDRDLDVREVGTALHVPYLLAGSVRKDDDELRITAELVDASDGLRLWSDTYDRRLESVFAIQSEIAEAIAEALRVPLGLDREALVSPTRDMDAYELYLRGRAALRRRGSGVAEAISQFEAAIERDSTWAPAWAGLAEARAIHPLYARPTGESTDSLFWARSFQEGEAAARRALELDPENASALVALGGIHRDRWEWEEAEAQLRRAIDLDPDSEEAHTQYAELLWGMGRLDESLVEGERARALDPSPIRMDVVGFVLYMNGRYAEAEAALEEGLAIDTAGDVHFLRTVLANQMLFQGRYREAIDRFAPYLEDSVAYRRMGEALDTGDPSLMPDSDARGVAQAWIRLGRPQQALDALETRVFAMPFRVQYDIWDPILELIWDTARFRDVILPRVRLAGVTPRFSDSIRAR